MNTGYIKKSDNQWSQNGIFIMLLFLLCVVPLLMPQDVNAASRQELEKAFQEETGKTPKYFIWKNFDRKGGKEAFAITGDFTKDQPSEGNNVEVWYVSASGECQCMQKDLYGCSYKTIKAKQQTFLLWEKDAHGSASLTYLFGVKDARAYQPKISGKYMGFSKKGSSYYAFVSDFSKGFHDYIKKSFRFQPSTGQFVKSTKGLKTISDRFMPQPNGLSPKQGNPKIMDAKTYKLVRGKWDMDGMQGTGEKRYAVFTRKALKWYIDGKFSYESKLVAVKRVNAKKLILK